MVIVNLLRGGKGTDSIIDLEICSAGDWIIQVCYLIFCIVITLYTKNLIQTQSKVRSICATVKDDIDFNGKKLLQLLVVAFAGGWVAGALGLGGGAIFNPILLEMGLPAIVSSATGMYMIMFSTAASTAVFMINDMILYDYALWIGFWCFFGSVVGLIMLNKIMKKLNRQSPIIILLSFILGISALIVPIFGVIDFINLTDKGNNIWEFGSICDWYVLNFLYFKSIVTHKIILIHQDASKIPFNLANSKKFLGYWLRQSKQVCQKKDWSSFQAPPYGFEVSKVRILDNSSSAGFGRS